jgi:superfamily II DNA or RNA helicase
MEISVGIKVMARGLPWEVLEVQPLGVQQRVRVACLGGDLQGLEWDLLHPAETVTPLNDDPGPTDAGTPAEWRRYHTAWLLDQVPGASAAPGRLTIEAYQRVPLLRALDMVRPRLMLADGVGLGKTIQAGLIASELIVRRRSHRVLVVAPPGPLLRQWEQEMRIRFGLRFTVIADAAGLRDARRGLELGANPFEATALCLTSIDFAKQDRVLSELERVAWDLVVIDEAHHCVAGMGEDSQRRRLADVLARCGDGLLLLTATPHDGYDPHFASLIALLDPSLVDGDGRLIGNGYRRHVVRRLKSHIHDTVTGTPLFRNRIVIPVRVEVSDFAAVRAFHQALSALVAPRLRRSRDKAGLADALAFVSLLKRSLSSIAACLATLRVVAQRYTGPPRPRGARQRALRAYRRRVAQFGVLDPAGEAELAELEAEEMADNLSGSDTQEALAELIRLAEAALPCDPKFVALVREIRLIRLTEPDSNILVYTEYADTQRAAVEALAAVNSIVLTISGADSEADRTRAAERCAVEDRIVLVSTDSLAEGLNLQQRCHHLIHLDLPYNPNRLEQRNGRIDRYGQRNDPQIRYLYLAETFEERLLLHLIGKYEKARQCLSVMPDTLAMGAVAGGMHEPLLTGFAERAQTLFSATAPLVQTLDLAAEDEGSATYRDLLREIDRAFQSFDRMAVRHGWLSGAEAPDPVDGSSLPVDLCAFVASVLTRQGDGFLVPVEWRQELEGLAGFDSASGTVWLATSPDQLRDESGRPLLYPGRSHPLTRRAVAWARSRRGGRVSAVRSAESGLLITYAAEVGGLFRRVFALRVDDDGSISEQVDFVALADCEQTGGLPRKWPDDLIARASGVAASVGERLGAAFSADYLGRIGPDVATANAWISARATALCGPVVSRTGDLFDSGPTVSDWRTCPGAFDRLSGFATDPGVSVEKRREAKETLAGFRALMAERSAELPKATVRILGVLFLCQ